MTPPRADESAEYKPFPAPGAPVFITHPAFKYDEGLRESLLAYQIQLFLVIQNGWEKPGLVNDKVWLSGEKRIPEKRLVEIMEERAEWLAKKKLLPDTPIGYQFLEGGEAAYRIPRRLDFIRRLFARGGKRQPASAPATKQHALTAN